MAKLPIDLSGIKGLAPRYFGDKPYTASSPNLRYLGIEGQIAEGVYNPISALGYMSPANNTTKAVTGTSDFLLTSAIVVPQRLADASTDAIFFSDEATTGTRGKILNLDTAVDTTLDTAYTIPLIGAEYSKSEDFVLYRVNGSRRIFFTNVNTTTPGTSSSIAIATYDFGTVDDDWSSTLPTGASSTLLKPEGRNVFVPADNGFLYVLNFNTVHRIDGSTTGGTNGTISADVLVFLGSASASGAGSIAEAIDGVDIRGKMWIAVHVNAGFSSKTTSLSGKAFNQFCGVYIWDRKTTVAGFEDFIPVYGVREIKSMHVLQGQVCLFTVSTDGYTQLRRWDGNEFSVVATLGSTAFPAYRKHSVYEAGDYLMWLGSDGKIYFFGKAEPFLDNALYTIGDMTTHVSNGQTYSGSGVFVPANATETVTSGNQTAPLAFYVSFKDTGGNHLKKWYPWSTETVASNAQVGHIGDVYTLVKYLPDMSKVNYVDIRCAPTGTGSTTIATVKYYFNGSSTASITKTVTKDQCSRGYVRHELNKPYINAIQIEIEFATGNTMGQSNDFRPSIAIVDYDDQPDKG